MSGISSSKSEPIFSKKWISIGGGILDLKRYDSLDPELRYGEADRHKHYDLVVWDLAAGQHFSILYNNIQEASLYPSLI